MAVGSRMVQGVGLLGWLGLCFAAAALGAAGSMAAPEVYARLAQPDWAPPGWLFGPVWTVLYTLMALSAWGIWRELGFARGRWLLCLFLLQLALNALWSWTFFAWQSGWLSMLVIVTLWALILACIAMFWRVRRWTALILLPYLAWVGFAAVLNAAMWRLNPEWLGG